jgi:hypothetical protein
MDELVPTVPQPPIQPIHHRPVDNLPRVNSTNHNGCISIEIYNQIIRRNCQLEKELVDIKSKYLTTLEQLVSALRGTTQPLQPLPNFQK